MEPPTSWLSAFRPSPFLPLILVRNERSERRESIKPDIFRDGMLLLILKGRSEKTARLNEMINWNTDVCNAYFTSGMLFSTDDLKRFVDEFRCKP